MIVQRHGPYPDEFDRFFLEAVLSQQLEGFAQVIDQFFHRRTLAMGSIDSRHMADIEPSNGASLDDDRETSLHALRIPSPVTPGKRPGTPLMYVVGLHAISPPKLKTALADTAAKHQESRPSRAR